MNQDEWKPSCRTYRRLTDDARQLYLQIVAGSRKQQPAPALDELLALMLIARSPDDPDVYLPLDPEPVANHWRETYHSDARELLGLADDLATQLRSLTRAYRVDAPNPLAGGVEYLEGLEAINARIGQVLASATSELLTAQPSGPRPAELLAISYSRDIDFLRRGGRIRTIYRADVRSDSPTSRWVETVAEAGDAEVRTLDVPFVRTIIVDRQTAVIEAVTPWTGPGEEPFRAVMVHDCAIAGYLAKVYEQVFAMAQPWHVGDGPELTDVQRNILRLLSEGKTQEQVARDLGLGIRTVTKHLGILRQLADAKTPYQLLYWWAKREGIDSAKRCAVRAGQDTA